MLNVLSLKALAAVAAVAALSGCASLNRTRPRDMTVPEHEHAAQRDLRKAQEASIAAAAGGRGASYERYSEQRHRELAAEHSAAAAALRAEVAVVCADVDASKSLAGSKIATVNAIQENDVPKHLRSPRGYYPERLKGARISLEVEDVTARPVVARSVECEAARTAALIQPVDPASPFAVRSAKAVVRSEGPDVVVEVRGDGRDAAEEILRRATALAQVPPESGR